MLREHRQLKVKRSVPLWSEEAYCASLNLFSTSGGQLVSKSLPYVGHIIFLGGGGRKGNVYFVHSESDSFRIAQVSKAEDSRN